MLPTITSARAVPASYLLVTAFALLTPPLTKMNDEHRGIYWGISAVLCLVILVATWRRRLLPKPVLLGAGWLLVALAVHLAFVLKDLLAVLAALPFSVAVLSVVNGQVGARTRKLLLTTHVVISGAWVGIAVVMVTMAILAATTTDLATAHERYTLIELFDITILPWSAIATIASGLAVSLTGKWGVIKHYWVLTKFALAVLVLASAFAFIHDWVEGAAEQSAELLATGGSVHQLEDLPGALVVALGYAGSLVVAATVLSVYKPWGRTRYGRREVANRRGRRRPGSAESSGESSGKPGGESSGRSSGKSSGKSSIEQPARNWSGQSSRV